VLVPLSWLAEFVPAASERPLSELIDTLNDLGLVVEGVEHVDSGLESVVVARVRQIEPIEGADKIRRVLVDSGGHGEQIVCGAWNFEVGDLVPLAPVGARLPQGMEIGRRKMRGVQSEGMLCSAAELGLAGGDDGLLLLGDDGSTSPGQPLVELAGLGTEVVLDLAVEPNRPDAMSIAGVARDLCARWDQPFALPEIRVARAGTPVADWSIEVLEPGRCDRFVVYRLSRVTVGVSPPARARRLSLAGMRPINSVVDASNYVMLELGQPSHPYDLDRINGSGFQVRLATPGEELITLDGTTRRLGEGSFAGSLAADLLICESDGTPIGMAGVMGGASTEIHRGTSQVILEVAHFDPMTIARTARRLGLRSEASARFERGCDPEILERAGLRVAELLGAGAALSPDHAEYRAEGSGERHRITLRLNRLGRLLGQPVPASEVAARLTPMGFEVTELAEPSGEPKLEVTVPSYRPDCRIEVDLVEEVARQMSYSKLTRQPLLSPKVGRLGARPRLRRVLGEVMVGGGCAEAWTATLIGPDDHGLVEDAGPTLTVANPLARDESVLRRTLLPGLLSALSYNRLRNQGEIRLFELGHVFEPPEPGEAGSGRWAGPVEESEHLAAILAGPNDSAVEAVALWKDLERTLRLEPAELIAGEWPGFHPTRTAHLVAPSVDEVAGSDGVLVGVVGEISPRVLANFRITGRVGALLVDLSGLEMVRRVNELARPVSTYPSAEMDMAFVVPLAVSVRLVERAIRGALGEVAESVALFDVYHSQVLDDAGEKSLAFRLRLSHGESTLTDAELKEARAAVIAAVERACGGRLR
jgi:phenylalanyl-tRNA synthetase beta chain